MLHTATQPFLGGLHEHTGQANALPPSTGFGRGMGSGGCISKMLQFYVKVFYVMGKLLSSELSCPGIGLVSCKNRRIFCTAEVPLIFTTKNI